MGARSVRWIREGRRGWRDSARLVDCQLAFRHCVLYREIHTQPARFQHLVQGCCHPALATFRSQWMKETEKERVERTKHQHRLAL